MGDPAWRRKFRNRFLAIYPLTTNDLPDLGSRITSEGLKRYAAISLGVWLCSRANPLVTSNNPADGSASRPSLETHPVSATDGG
jgi:hypothetical protein